ncbi:MAG TPA: aminodeoxychorismate/anthranilate synthase component II [Thermoanaerobaculia bacterium]|nr:aminodeoxychorismate/anthranilate synthase component II [Thermoanaerobaculia bacterium]
MTFARPSILMIDNYDSFTYNLVQFLTVAGAEVTVLRNDAESAEAMLERRPVGIVISPGPGRPEDAGVCLDLLAGRPAVPILGVCLGHQAIGQSFGATVDRAEQLMHGKTSEVEHDGDDVFAGLDNPFTATRYHSLDVRPDTLPDELVPTAWSDDRCLMAMRHRELPYRSVQFHPESVLTVAGPRLLANFLELAVAYGERREEKAG